MEPKSVALGEERETVALATAGGRPQFTPVCVCVCVCVCLCVCVCARLSEEEVLIRINVLCYSMIIIIREVAHSFYEAKST